MMLCDQPIDQSPTHNHFRKDGKTFAHKMYLFINNSFRNAIDLIKHFFFMK